MDQNLKTFHQLLFRDDNVWLKKIKRLYKETNQNGDSNMANQRRLFTHLFQIDRQNYLFYMIDGTLVLNNFRIIYQKSGIEFRIFNKADIII